MATSGDHDMNARLTIPGSPEPSNRIEPNGSPIEPKGRGPQMFMFLLLLFAVIVAFFAYDYRNGFRELKKIQWAFVTPSKEKALEMEYAISGGRIDHLRTQVDFGTSVNIKLENGERPLHRAIRTGHPDIVRFFIEKGAKVDAKNDEKETPLHLAAKHSNDEIADLLLEKGADPTARDEDGLTPFYWSVRNGDVSCARRLLKAGADISEKYSEFGYTPIHEAVDRNNKEMVAFLLSCGASPNGTTYSGKTPLFFSKRENSEEVMEMLLQKKADANAREKENGWTPLHVIAVSGKPAQAKLLIRYGADVNAKAKYGDTPLHLACGAGNLDLARMLIREGAAINAQNVVNMTPLHTAAHEGKVEIVKLLLDEVADPTMKDNGDRTPLDHAKMTLRYCDVEPPGMRDVIRMLEGQRFESDRK